VFFPGGHRNMADYRLLVHFYAYTFFSDPTVDHRIKRIVRDRLRYRDEIFCAAGQAVQQLHQLAASLPPHRAVQSSAQYSRKTGGGKMDGPDRDAIAVYFAFHIRRGDFQ
jgi:hypothetical protein